MTLRFQVFGFEIAKVELDFGEDAVVAVPTVADKAVKGISGFWFRRMTAR